MPTSKTKTKINVYPVHRGKRWEHWLGLWNQWHGDQGKDFNLPAAFFDISLTNSVTTHQPDNWNWKKLTREHENATTYMVGDVFEFTRGSASCYASYKGWLGSWPLQLNYSEVVGGIPMIHSFPSDPSNLSTIDADNRARMRLLKDLADKRRAFQGMTFVGELSKTLRGLRNPAQALRNSLDDWINSAKKLNPKRGVDNLNRALSGSWLEWTYGIAPLIGDVERGKEALNRTLNRYESLYQRFVSVGESEKILNSDFLYSEGPYSDWRYTQRIREFSQSYVKYYGQVYTAAILGNSLAQRQNLGFTLNDFVPTVWELIPYSFVIDYFTNIGDLIEACSTYTGDVAWISRGIKKTTWKESHFIKADFCSDFTQLPNSWLVSDKRLRFVSHSPTVISRSSIERTGLAQVPTVNPFSDLRFEIPGKGSIKWINLSALLANGRSTERFLRGISR